MSKTFQFGNGEWAVGKETALAYNDENSNFKPLAFTFDRSTVATVVNKQGLIETVGIDEPRIDFLNNTKGHLLLEPSRRNLFTYSQDASQWGYSGITTPVSQDGSINNPDGVSGANEIIPTSGSALKYFFPNNTYSHTSGDTYSFSVFAKANELKYIQITGNSNAFGSGQYANFDLENGVIGTYAGATSGTTPKIEDYGNGWYRCQFQVNASATTTQNIFLVAIVPSSSASRLQALNPNGSDSLYVYGFQAELGSYATSYIPTQGETNGVSRGEEDIALTLPDNSSFNSSVGFTLYGEFLTNGGNGASPMAVQFNGNTGYFGFGHNSVTWRARVNNGTDNELHTSSASIFSVGKLALSFSSSGFSMYANGASFASGNTDMSAITSSDSVLYRDTEEFGSFQIRELKLYNTRLSDNELQALTS